MTTPQRGRVALLGLGLSAILASACCWLPLLLVAFGATTVGVSGFFEAYRPSFIAATLLFLAVAFWLSYRPRPQATESCCHGKGGACPIGKGRNRIVLWAVALFSLGFLFFPQIATALSGSPQRATVVRGATGEALPLHPVVLQVSGMTCAACAAQAAAAASKAGYPARLLDPR